MGKGRSLCRKDIFISEDIEIEDGFGIVEDEW